MLECARRGMRSLVCRYRNLLIRDEASRSRISSSCTMNTWRDSGCSSSSSPGATGPGAGSTGYTSCWKLTFGMDGGLSQGGGAQTGRAGLTPAPSSSSHPAGPNPISEPRLAAAWTPLHGHPTGNSNLRGHTELSTSSPEPTWPRCHGLPVCALTPSANPRAALALQSLRPRSCWFCFLKMSLTSLCTSVISTAAIFSLLPGWPPCLSPLTPTHPEGSALAPLSGLRGAPAPSSQHSSPASRGLGPGRLAQHVAPPPATAQGSLAGATPCTPPLPAAPPAFLPHQNLSRI